MVANYSLSKHITIHPALIARTDEALAVVSVLSILKMKTAAALP
jgi:hypothetical protein